MFLDILLLFGLQHSTEKSSQSNLQKLTQKGGFPKNMMKRTMIMNSNLSRSDGSGPKVEKDSDLLRSTISSYLPLSSHHQQHLIVLCCTICATFVLRQTSVSASTPRSLLGNSDDDDDDEMSPISAIFGEEATKRTK